MNIKDYIRDEVSKGFTFDQIAQAMTRALNEAEEEHNKSKEIEKYLDGCFDAICAALDTNNVGYDTVGELAAIAYANTHSNSKVEEIREVADKVQNYAAASISRSEKRKRSPLMARNIVPILLLRRLLQTSCLIMA